MGTFALGGVCNISCSVIVSLLQQIYGISYGLTGVLISFLNVGNMTASFVSGMLAARIGLKSTIRILCVGFTLGYLLMTSSSAAPVLMLAFGLVGMAMGSTTNTCTVLVGDNSRDRSMGMSLMHACYACGALLCPFLIAWMSAKGDMVPMFALAALGIVVWLVFFFSGLPGKNVRQEGKAQVDMSFLKSARFWLLTVLLFSQNAAETSVTGWMVTYFRDQHILSGMLSTYTVTILWGTTLIARLLIVFVFKIRDTFRTLAVMGTGCLVFYAGMIVFTGQPVLAVGMLVAFSFAMAGINPMVVAGMGKDTSPASMGIVPCGIVCPRICALITQRFSFKTESLS